MHPDGCCHLKHIIQTKRLLMLLIPLLQFTFSFNTIIPQFNGCCSEMFTEILIKCFKFVTYDQRTVNKSDYYIKYLLQLQIRFVTNLHAILHVFLKTWLKQLLPLLLEKDLN